jgi:hypothetical protein
MKTAKLTDGTEFEVDEAKLDDWRFIDDLELADEGDVFAASRAITKFLGKEQKEKLWEKLEDENGQVHIADGIEAVKELMSSLGDEGKN